MKTIVTLLTVLGLAGAAYAGCGKTETSKGELKSYDADAKSITVSDKSIKLTPSTVIKDKDGKAVEITALVGKKVEVVAGHGKAETVTGS